MPAQERDGLTRTLHVKRLTIQPRSSFRASEVHIGSKGLVKDGPPDHNHAIASRAGFRDPFVLSSTSHSVPCQTSPLVSSCPRLAAPIPSSARRSLSCPGRRTRWVLKVVTALALALSWHLALSGVFGSYAVAGDTSGQAQGPLIIICPSKLGNGQSLEHPHPPGHLFLPVRNFHLCARQTSLRTTTKANESMNHGPEGGQHYPATLLVISRGSSTPST